MTRHSSIVGGSPERWLPIVGFEDYYEVSDLGRVKSLARTCYAGNNSYRRVDERVLKGLTSGLSRNGSPRKYLAVNLRAPGVSRRREIQMLVLEAFSGPRPAGFQARHLNGIQDDNRIANLAWSTVAENCADTLKHGTRPLGTQKSNAKLREADIPGIRASREAGASWRQLARQYNVSTGTVRNVIRKKAWNHVEA